MTHCEQSSNNHYVSSYSLSECDRKIIDAFRELVLKPDYPVIVAPKDYHSNDCGVFDFRLDNYISHYFVLFHENVNDKINWYYLTPDGLVQFNPIPHLKQHFLNDKFKLHFTLPMSNVVKISEILRMWNITTKSDFDIKFNYITSNDVILSSSLINDDVDEIKIDKMEFKNIVKYFKWSPWVIMHSDEEFSDSLLLNHLPEFENLLIMTCRHERQSNGFNYEKFAKIYFNFYNSNSNYAINPNTFEFCLMHMTGDALFDLIVIVNKFNLSDTLYSFFRKPSFIKMLRLNDNRKINSKQSVNTIDNFCKYMRENCCNKTIVGLFCLFSYPIDLIRKIGYRSVNHKTNELIRLINPSFWGILEFVEIPVNPWMVLSTNIDDVLMNISDHLSFELLKTFLA